MQGIYAIRHIESARTYVGSSVNIERRWRQHKSAFNRGDHPAAYLAHAFLKYGASAFEFSVLEECENLTERENHWMALLKPAFNVAPVAGSVLGIKRTEETRMKMADAQRGIKRDCSSRIGLKLSEAHRSALSLAKKGKALSAEHKAKIAAAMKGKIRTPQHRAALSLAHTGLTRSEQARKNIRMACVGRKSPMEGKKHSLETKLKISATQKLRLNQASPSAP